MVMLMLEPMSSLFAWMKVQLRALLLLLRKFVLCSRQQPGLHNLHFDLILLMLIIALPNISLQKSARRDAMNR